MPRSSPSRLPPDEEKVVSPVPGEGSLTGRDWLTGHLCLGQLPHFPTLPAVVFPTGRIDRGRGINGPGFAQSRQSGDRVIVKLPDGSDRKHIIGRLAALRRVDTHRTQVLCAATYGPGSSRSFVTGADSRWRPDDRPRAAPSRLRRPMNALTMLIETSGRFNPTAPRERVPARINLNNPNRGGILWLS